MNRRWLGSLIAIVIAGLASIPAALADTRGRSEYSGWISEQSLTLPKWTAQITGEANLTSVHYEDSLGVQTDDTLGVGVGLGFDLGLPHHLQVGAFISISAHPQPNIGLFAANFQIGLLRQVSLRFDVGMIREGVWGSDSSTAFDGFLGGVSVPWRVRLHRRILLQGWQASARDIGAQPTVAADSHTRLYGLTLFTEDLFVITAAHDRFDQNTYVSGSLYVPVALVVQPIQPLSLLVQVAYRLQFEHSSRSTATQHYLPLRLGVTGHIKQLVDIGFVATILGPLSSDTNQSKSTSLSGHWSDFREFDFYVAGRF